MATEYESPRGSSSKRKSSRPSGITLPGMSMLVEPPPLEGVSGSGRGRKKQKRTAPSTSSSSSSSSKKKKGSAAVDDGQNYDQMLDEARFAKFKRGGRRGRRKGPRSKLGREGERIMGQANQAFLDQDLDTAANLLMGLVKRFPHCDQVYRTLALVMRELGLMEEAAQFYLIAAHLTKKDPSEWKSLAIFAQEHSLHEIAITAWTKVIRSSVQVEDLEAYKNRAMMYLEVGEYQKAAHGLQTYLHNRTDDQLQLRNLAQALYLSGSKGKATVLLEKYMKPFTSDQSGAQISLITEEDAQEMNLRQGTHTDPHTQQSLSLSSGNKERRESSGVLYLNSTLLYNLVELYDIQKTYQKGLALLRHVQSRLPQGAVMPVDLAVRKCIFELHAGANADTEATITSLFSHELFNNEDLHRNLGEALYTNGLYDEAAKVFGRLAEDLEGLDDAIRTHLAHSLRLSTAAQGSSEEAVAVKERARELYESVLSRRPDDEDVRVSLSELYADLDQSDKALAVLDYHGITTTHSLPGPSLPSSSRKGKRGKSSSSRSSSSSSSSISFPSSSRPPVPDHPYLPGTTEDEGMRSAVVLTDPGIRDLLEEFPSTFLLPRTLRMMAQKCDVLLTQGRFEEFLAECQKPVEDTVKATLKTLFEDGEEVEDDGDADEEEREEGGEAKRMEIEREAIKKKKQMKNRKEMMMKKKKKRKKSKSLAQRSVVSRTCSSMVGSDLFFGLATNLLLAFHHFRSFEAGNEIATALQEWLNHCYSSFKTRLSERSVLSFRRVAMRISFHAGSFDTAFDIGKSVISHYPQDEEVVGLFSQILVKLKFPTRCCRFVRRLFATHDNSAPLAVLLGHTHLARKTYRTALLDYVRAYRLCRGDPGIHLFIGTTMLQYAMARSNHNRHTCIAKGFSFLFSYYTLRGGDSEASFNLARAFHSLGAVDWAVSYYERCLRGGPLKREAAHNLSLIYNSNGAPDLARQVLVTHFTV